MAAAMRQCTQAGCSTSAAAVSISSRLAVVQRPPPVAAARGAAFSQRQLVLARSHKVEIEHQGKTYNLEVPDGATILEVALDNGLDLPHDCKLGVCMTCPAKLVAGQVDQSGSMLSDDVAEKGYALLCMAVPQTDVKIMTVSEDELLEEQLCA